MQIKRNRRAGFTLVEIMIVVGIIGLLAAMIAPNMLTSREKATQTTCINNLTQISGAKDQWALETHAASTATPSEQDLAQDMGRGASGAFPKCPGGGTYTINNLSTDPTCSATAGKYPHDLKELNK